MTAPPKTVLLVEDQPDLKVFLSNLLISGEYTTIFAAGKAEGLAKAMAEKPDLIIIDMMMPVEQGIRLYRALKSNGHLAELPVIMLSSIKKRTFFQCHRIREQQSARSLPVPEAYIETPPEAEELLRLVRELITPQYRVHNMAKRT